MKTQIRLIIGVVIGLVVGFGAGLYTGQVRVAAVKQATESPELLACRANLNKLRMIFTDEAPQVKKLQERILALENKQRAK